MVDPDPGLKQSTGFSSNPVVSVIDDDEAALHSLGFLLRAEGVDAREYASAVAFLENMDPAERGCVVTDVRMPGMDGVELIRTLRARGCFLPVIVMTGHADVALAVRAMKAGAAEFIEKPFESDLILRLVAACLADNDAAADANSTRAGVARRLESLTGRERQVLDCVILGASNKVIALQLGISPRTVEIHRANLMTKMQADSLSALVRMTVSTGGG